MEQNKKNNKSTLDDIIFLVTELGKAIGKIISLSIAVLKYIIFLVTELGKAIGKIISLSVVLQKLNENKKRHDYSDGVFVLTCDSK